MAGKRVQKYFQTETGALTWAQEQHQNYQKSGPEAFAITDKPDDAASLSAVISLFLAQRAGTAGEKTLRNHLGKFAGIFGGLAPDDISPVTVRAWFSGGLSEYEPRTRYGIFTSCRQLWRWALRYDHVKTALFDKVEPPSKGDSQIAILTPNQMEAALKESPNDYVTAWLALGGFAGLRSCEILRMDWADVGKEIHIRREVIKKTRGIKERYVARTDALNRHLARIGEKSGKVIPVALTTFYYHTKRLAESLGFEDGWPHNALRDSFASYMLAECEDAGKVAHEMGHTSPAMVHRNYARAVKKADAVKWWKA